MFYHFHPYEPFIPVNATKLIVGTLPPPRFCTKDLKTGDVDFCYGSIDGQLWPILDSIFKLNLKFETTDEAIHQRKVFLESRGIGICDIVASAERNKIDASDLGMQNVKLRDLIGYLHRHPKIDTLLFTGGNSKNGPEYFFRRHLKEYGLTLEVISDEVPRIHQFVIAMPRPRQKQSAKEERIIKTVSLTAPSGAANRAVGSLPLYKKLKDADPRFNTIDFRVMQYREFF
ncbi:uracil-DNA glycosylase family protein [Sungkyunkwania multivorans]|uniref:Uracil-DNA glycosylase family protein n=1 Tax=Sungkyunkwania multivorans TaxID=1173618 RepID=A0ABW3CXS8_9FLAO